MRNYSCIFLNFSIPFSFYLFINLFVGKISLLDKEPKSLCETSYMEYGKQMEILYAHNSIRSKFSHDNGTSPSPAKDYKLVNSFQIKKLIII